MRRIFERKKKQKPNENLENKKVCYLLTFVSANPIQAKVTNIH